MKVNRLVRARRHSAPLFLAHLVPQEDSITLWREICGNKLLDGATLILFFNKVKASCYVSRCKQRSS